MTTAYNAQPQVWVMHRSTAGGSCCFCHHPIRHYDRVGWVDTTAAYYGGSYDMCAHATTGQHEPS
jgi:hypothetical protein